MSGSHQLGSWGEDEAEAFLKRKGLRFVERHFLTRWGEIDRIFRHGDTWVFVEVKTRDYSSAFPIVESVSHAKQHRLLNAAYMYMKKNRLQGQSMRFDLVLIVAGVIEWIPNAFESTPYYTY